MISCAGAEATHWCHTCDKYLCSSCTTSHKIRAKSHLLIAIKVSVAGGAVKRQREGGCSNYQLTMATMTNTEENSAISVHCTPRYPAAYELKGGVDQVYTSADITGLQVFSVETCKMQHSTPRVELAGIGLSLGYTMVPIEKDTAVFFLPSPRVTSQVATCIPGSEYNLKDTTNRQQLYHSRDCHTETKVARRKSVTCMEVESTLIISRREIFSPRV